MSNFSVRWRLCQRRDFLVTPTVAPNYGWVHGKSIMSRCYCPPLFRRSIHRIHNPPALSCFPWPTNLLLPSQPSSHRSVLYICSPLSSPLTRRSRDNSLVKRPDDASLFYRGSSRLKIAFAPRATFSTCSVPKEGNPLERIFARVWQS